MEHNAYNELTAAYALDALDDADVRSFEEHLAGCSACQADVASLSATAVALSDVEALVVPAGGLARVELAGVPGGDGATWISAITHSPVGSVTTTPR